MKRLLPLVLLAAGAAAPAAAQTTFDVSVKEIFAASPDSIAKARTLQTAGTLNGAAFERLTRSRYTDRVAPVDTLVRFTAVLLSDPLNSGLASVTSNRVNRVHVFVRDVKAANATAGTIERGFVAQVVDGAYDTDGLLQLAPGAVVKITGSLAYFSNQPQISPTSLEVVATDYVAAGYPRALAEPIATELNALNRPGPEDPANPGRPQATVNLDNYPGNAYEYVRLTNLAVEASASFANGQRFNLVFSDPARTVFTQMADISLRFRNDRATYPAPFNKRSTNFAPPAVGSRVNLTAFTIPFTNDNLLYFNPNVSVQVVPFEDADLQVLAGGPPAVANVRLTTPGVVRGTSAVSVSADVAPAPDRTIGSVTLFYRPFGGGTYSSVLMTAGASTGSSIPYTASIPSSALVDGSFVEFYVSASDNTGTKTDSPTQSFRVLSGGITKIEHVQRPADSGTGASPFAGTTFSATSNDFLLNAVVMSRPDTSGFVTIQDDAALGPWSGVWLETTTATRALRKGDQIRITAATVAESNGQTRLTGVTFTKTGTTMAYGYKVVTTTDLATPSTAEAHEGMALRLNNLTVVNKNADAPSDFGEFLVTSSGSSSNIRIDDFSTAVPDRFNAQLSTGQTLTFAQGIWDYSFNNYKLEPEVVSDLGGLTIDAADEVRLDGVALVGIAPNPAASLARVAFRTAVAGSVRVDVIDVLGRRVATLVDATLAAGDHSADLDAAGLAAGVYVVRLSQGGATATRTVVVR